MDKVRVIVRADLRPGQQAVQAMHAKDAFAHEYVEAEQAWFEESNTLALLSVPDERTLRKFLERALNQGIRASYFCEPDMQNEMTAIALEPGVAARRLCGGLPPAFTDL